MDILVSAQSELDDIERKLAGMLPLQQRREQLRQFINIGRVLYAPQAAPQQPLQSAPTAEQDALPSPQAMPGTRTKQSRIANGAIAILAAGPMSTRAIVARLEALGVNIDGKDKVADVSAVLSRDKARFKSDRAAGGWLLVQPHKEVPPPGAPTPAGA